MGMSSLKLLKYVLFFFNLLFWVSVSVLSMAALTSSQLRSTPFLYWRASGALCACLGCVQHTQPRKKIILSSPLPTLPLYKLAELKGTSVDLWGGCSSGALGCCCSLLTSVGENLEPLHSVY